MSPKDLDPKIRALFDSAKEIAEKKKNWVKLGYECDPCDPFLPIKHSKAFYGTNNREYRELIAFILDFIQNRENDIIFLKGPLGSGKTIFAQIFEKYSKELDLFASYQDASSQLSEDNSKMSERMHFVKNKRLEDVILLDNSFLLHRSLRKLLTFDSTVKSAPKIIAIMNSTEFEVYRRWCIQTGDKSYQHFLSMPQLKKSDIIKLIKTRLQVCYGKQAIPIAIENILENIAVLSQGNPGLAIRILEETLKFSRSLDDLRLSFGIDPNDLSDFPPSKSPILREILVCEIQNELLPPFKREYIRHKNLTQIMNKTKSTISHHLGDLLNRNLIFEQIATHDKRERSYRPNKTILGILEYLAFELPFIEDNLMMLEGINREE